MSKALKNLTAAVDILLLIDIASDLVRKYRERKAEKDDIDTDGPQIQCQIRLPSRCLVGRRLCSDYK